MKGLAILFAALALLIPTGLVLTWVGSAADRLAQGEAMPSTAPKVAVAAAADEAYCTPQLKLVLRRVLKSCGLLESGEVRGCQPTDAKQVATLAGGDFNALFMPMAKRAGVVEFEQNACAARPGRPSADRQTVQRSTRRQLLLRRRACLTGRLRSSTNRELSKQRANAVMNYLREKYKDPDLDHEVGLLWLGEEFAQLDQRFCEWQRSGSASSCTSENLNRSAFISWIDCQL